MSAKCIKEMLRRAKKLNVELTEREAAEIFRNIQKTRNESSRNRFTAEEMSKLNPTARLVEHARRAFDKTVAEKQEALRRKYLQVQKNVELSTKLREAKPGKRMKALDSEVFKLDQRKESLISQDLAEMSDALEVYNKALGYRISRGEAINVVREIGDPGSTGDANAKRLAESWMKVTTESRARMNAAGADIGSLKDWIMPQVWDAPKMKRIGVTQFVDDAMQHIDRSKYYDADTGKQLTDAEIRTFLVEAHETIVTDGLNKPLSKLTGAPQGRGSLGKRLGDKHRALHFKNADSWYAMTEDYGQRDIFSLMMTTIQNNGRNLSMLEGFGPNPNVAFQGALALAQNLDKSSKGANRARNYFAELTGENNVPGSALLANSMQGLRQWLVATKLGSMLLSQTNDAAIYAVMARSDGMGMGKAMRVMVKSLAATKNQKREARKQQVYSQSITNDVAARYGETVKGHRLTSRMAAGTIKLAGGNWWDSSLKRGFQTVIGNHLSIFSKQKFSKLEPDFRKMLERYNIAEADWNIIRRAEPVNILGEMIITPTTIRLMGDAPGIRSASLKVGDMMGAEADIAVPTPGLRERALVRSGTKPGTAAGEFMRSVALFKTFSLTMITKVIPRIFNRQTLKTTKGASLAAQFTISMMVMGGVSYQLKEIAKGRDPIDITTPGFWGKAFAQSGGAGIFGDFLSADVNRFGGGLGATIGGPVVGIVEDSVKLTLGNLKKVARGKDTTFGSDAVRMAGGNIPIINLWYTKAAINHMLIQQAQDALNPGYSRRLRRKTRNTFNQGEWWKSGALFPERPPALEDIAGGRR